MPDIDPTQFLAPGQQAQSVFGLETPEGALARVKARFAQRRRDFFASNASTDHGRQVGQAFADIFGPAARRALDTSVARKAEQERLISAGTNPEEARKQAKASIDPQFAEVRRANAMQGLGVEAQGQIDTLLDSGVAPAKAQAVGMLTMARRLEGQGFRQEATQMRLQAGELLQADELREAQLDDLLSTTGSRDDSRRRDNLELLADSDNFMLFEDGILKDAEAVPVVDVKRRRELEDMGYLKGGSSLGFALDGDSMKLTISDNTRESILAQINMLNGLDVLRSVRGMAGIVKGPALGLGLKLGLVTDDQLVNASAVADKMSADIQAMIKGIPSNYDAELFQLQVPDPRKSQSQAMYVARIDLLEDNVRKAIELTVSAHKGTNKEMPQELLHAMERMGIDQALIDPMSQEEYDAAVDAHNVVMEAQIDTVAIQDPQAENETATTDARQSVLDQIAAARAAGTEGG